MAQMRVGDLYDELAKYDRNLPIIVLKDGKGDDISLSLTDVEIVDGAYFGNDLEGLRDFAEDSEFLRIGIV